MRAAFQPMTNRFATSKGMNACCIETLTWESWRM
jgi:hypothetical protein